MLPSKRNVQGTPKIVDEFEEQEDSSIVDGATASKNIKLEVKEENPEPSGFAHSSALSCALNPVFDTPPLPLVKQEPSTSKFNPDISTLKSEDLNTPIVDSSSTLEARAEHEIEVMKEISGRDLTFGSSSLKQFSGQRVVHSDHLHLLILNWEVASKYQIFQKKEFKSLFNVFTKVRNKYSDHQEYYNLYFPLMMAEYWNKLFLSYESSAECYSYHVNGIKLNKTPVPELEGEMDTWLMECDAIVPTVAVPFNPKEKHVLLVNCNSGEFLAVVRMSVRRDFSAHHDTEHPTVLWNCHHHGTSPKTKVKLELEFACSPPPVSAGDKFTCRKLDSLKTLLRQHDAVLHLRESPMMKPLLDMKTEIVELPLMQENMNLALDTISQRVLNLDHHITLVAIPDIKLVASPDITLAASPDISPIAPIVDRLHRDLRRPILVCTSEEHLSTAVLRLQALGMNCVVLDRELRGDYDLKDRSLDFLANERSQVLGFRFPSVQPVIGECDVMVASTVSCFYDDVNAVSKFDTCLVFGAHSFTETESVVCLSYDVRHLVLIGCPGKVCATSNMTSQWDFGKSLFKRAYDAN